LIAMSLEPETIVLPSGEKTTEVTDLPCAFCFSALSSKDVKDDAGSRKLKAPSAPVLACGGFEKAQPIARRRRSAALGARDAPCEFCECV